MPTSRRRFAVPAAALAALLSLAFATAATAHHDRSGSPLVKPGHRVQGDTPGQWLGRWWTTVLTTSSPEDHFPGCAPLGRRVVGSSSRRGAARRRAPCAEGSQLMLVPDTTSCSDWEPPPFHGDTPAERRACARLILEGAGVPEVTIDGRHFLLDDAYRAVAPDQRATLPEDNFLEAPAGTRVRFGGDGWVAFTKPLSRGRHELVLHATGTFDGEPYDVTGVFHVDVV